MHKIGMCGQTTHHYITKLEIGYRAGCLPLTNYLYRNFVYSITSFIITSFIVYSTYTVTSFIFVYSLIDKLPKGLIDIKHFRWGLIGAGTKSKLNFLLCLLKGPTTLFTQF